MEFDWTERLQWGREFVGTKKPHMYYLYAAMADKSAHCAIASYNTKTKELRIKYAGDTIQPLGHNKALIDFVMKCEESERGLR